MPLVDLSTHTEEFNADPYPFYAALRTAGPVHEVVLGGERTWLVVGHEEARQALAHPALSKNWFGAGVFGDAPVPAVATSMLDADPPHHTRLRALVAREFTPAGSDPCAPASSRSPTNCSTRWRPGPTGGPT